MNDREHCINVCNRLLRGERSAVETYDKAIERFDDLPAVVELQRIRDEHVVAVRALEQNVLSMGAAPDEGTGAWGKFAKTVQSAANMFGAESAINALQQGEEHGRENYESALHDDAVMDECKDLMIKQLLPPIREHIVALENLQKTA